MTNETSPARADEALPAFAAAATVCPPSPTDDSGAPLTTTQIPSNPRAALRLRFSAIHSRSIHRSCVPGLQARKPDPLDLKQTRPARPAAALISWNAALTHQRASTLAETRYDGCLLLGLLGYWEEQTIEGFSNRQLQPDHPAGWLKIGLQRNNSSKLIPRDSSRFFTMAPHMLPPSSPSPDGIVCSAEVYEEVPRPVSHFEKILHAL